MWGPVVINKSVIEIVTKWDIVAARQLGRNEARRIGFNSVDQARITTVVSELAKGLYLYALAGEIIIERIEDGSQTGIRVLAIDKSQEIHDVRNLIENKFSTTEGLGVGLTRLKRLMDDLEIQYNIEKGTTIKVEKWLK